MTPRGAVCVLCLVFACACSGNGQTQKDGGGDDWLCETRLDCPGRLGCVEGVCGNCLRDRDCAANEYCHPVDNLCQPYGGGECRVGDDCPLGQFCVQGWCRDASEVVPCNGDGDCPAGQRCDPLNLVCVDDYGCNRDQDCAPGEVCDLARQQCVTACTPETEDVVCGAGLVCDEKGRCVECTDDGDCGVGLRCNTETNRCQGENSCLTSRDCLPGQVCNPQTRQCTEPPPACLSDEDCAEEMVCEVKTGRCVQAGCEPDLAEPNDSPGEAEPLAPGRTDDLRLCEGDVDWFSVTLVRGDRLMVIVQTDFLASQRFQTVLFDPAAEQVLQEDSLLIDYTVDSAGDYLLRTQTLDPRAEYDLIVYVSRGIPCDDDDYEPNDDFTQAAVLTAGFYPGLAICPRDEDWFVVERSPQQRLVVTMEHPAADGQLDLDLLAGDGRTLVDRSAGAGDTEVVTAVPGARTRFFVRVYGAPETQNGYQLTIELAEEQR